MFPCNTAFRQESSRCSISCRVSCRSARGIPCDDETAAKPTNTASPIARQRLLPADKLAFTIRIGVTDSSAELLYGSMRGITIAFAEISLRSLDDVTKDTRVHIFLI